MSYLNPDDDEIYIKGYEKAIRKDPYLGQDVIQYVPGYRQNLPHMRLPVQYPRTFNTYVKLPVSAIGSFIIDNGIYERLKDKLQRDLSTPVFGIDCQVITIRPDPKTNTHYYFQYEGYPSIPRMQEVGWFHSTTDIIKLTVPCPYYDSYFSGVSEHNFVIPWYRQTHFATSEVVADNFISPVTSNNHD